MWLVMLLASLFPVTEDIPNSLTVKLSPVLLPKYRCEPAEATPVALV